jgi:type I restriction enzyme R subunit
MDMRSEKETREQLIDPKLSQAHWEFAEEKGTIEAGKACVEIPVHGMPATSQSPSGDGFIDYVLFGKDAKPLAIIEAKKSCLDPEKGRVQASIYADALEKQYGVRPVIYLANGYEVDVIDGMFPQRRVFGFHTLDELEHLIQKRSNSLKDRRLDMDIAGRYYQVAAINSVLDYFASKHSRSLVVMATGTGKTRIAVSLSDILLRNNFVKRILFLADRKNLCKQAKEKNFNKLLPDLSTALLCDGVKDDNGARVVFSTYQTMISIVNGDDNKYGIGYFDLIIVDEAHRSLFKKYGELFQYFDAYMVGLTATPRDDVDKSTYKVFDLDSVNAPNYDYELIKGVSDGFLTYFRALDRTTDLLKNGLRYADLSEEEKQEYEDKFTEEDGTMAEEIDGSDFYDTILNEDTIRKVLSTLMDEGLKVNGGDLLGKSIIFARDHKHALEILKTFRKMYPELAVPKPGGRDFCVVIDNQIVNNESLQDEFQKPDSTIRIVVSVDMMDTGVDVPDLLNLVFFKRVLSKIKFLQMIGRGTRLCHDIDVVSPSKAYFDRQTDNPERKHYADKQGFLIFDICDNFEFFAMNPDGRKAKKGDELSLTQKIFLTKTEVLFSLQKSFADLNESEKAFLKKMEGEFAIAVSDFNHNYIGVQSNLEFVEKYSDASQWSSLTIAKMSEISQHIVPIVPPDGDDPSAKIFDLIAYDFELSRHDQSVDGGKVAKTLFRLISKGLLESKIGIQAVKEKETILKKAVSPEFVNEADVVAIDSMREDIRDLMKFIEREVFDPIRTDFEDRIYSMNVIDDSFGKPTAVKPTPIDTKDFRTYDEKAEEWVKNRFDDPSIMKIRMFEPLSAEDEKRLSDSISDLGDEAEATDFFSAVKPIVFIRKTAGIDEKAQKRFVASESSKYGLSDQQAIFVGQLIRFISANGYFTETILLNADDFADFTEIFKDQNTLPSIIDDIKLRMGA